jgi:IclR family transcriptional regulator, acetate operon repressor
MDPETERILATGEGGSAVLARGLALLHIVHSVGEISVRDLSQRSRIPLATTYRLVRQLVESGFAIENDCRIHAGPQIAPTPAAGPKHLVDYAAPFLWGLARETGLTAVLTVRVHTLALCLDVVRGDQTQSASFQIGEPSALHAGASATPLLAYAPKRVLAQARAGGFKRYTAHTPGEEEVLAKLQTIRSRGYDVTFGERQPLWAAVGVPVFDEGELLCCLSLTGPSLGFPPTDRLVNKLTVAATRLSQSIPRDVRTELWQSDDRQADEQERS